ncbi:FecR family protein [Flammeovirga sp. SubArs3]|uniref:FecR family protein n=1 Tax=Flammeovirga sp. SubArs3 TaxID=2995316 RepID=UPI00248C3B05|nr:FecR family protein [Flammeovirga sp. SubArs3]
MPKLYVSTVDRKGKNFHEILEKRLTSNYKFIRIFMDKEINIDWTLIAECLGGDDQAVVKAKEVAAQDATFKSVLSEVTEIWNTAGSMEQGRRSRTNVEALDEKVDQIWQKILEIESEESEMAASLEENNSNVDQDVLDIWKASSSLGHKQRKEVSGEEMDAAMAKMLLRMSVDEKEEKPQNTTFKVEKNTAVSQGKKSMWNFQVRMAASVAVLLTVGFTLYFSLTGEADLKTFESGSVVALVELPDGTEVWLNKNSSITYPEEFASDSRQVTLKGDAFFDVHRNPQKPFSIITDKAKTTVLGTSFHLKENEVEVVTGKVRFEDKNSGDYVVLVKDEKGILSTEGVNKLTYDSHDALSLRQSNLVFQGNTLKEVTEVLSKAYGVDIVIENQNLEARKFTGTFNNKSIETVIEQVTEVIGCSSGVTEDGKVLLK